jgi:hypothetical protein
MIDIRPNTEHTVRYAIHSVMSDSVAYRYVITIYGVVFEDVNRTVSNAVRTALIMES